MAGSKKVQSDVHRKDVHVSFEEQQKINKYARQNCKLYDLKKELKRKENEQQNLEDACSELELLDSDSKIPFRIGEIFVNEESANALTCIEEEIVKKKAEIVDLEEKCNELKNAMSVLKSELYAKFGNHICLEADEE